MLIVLTSCGAGEDVARSAGEADEFGDFFVPERAVSLEESDAVLSVTPFVTVEPTGEFTIADPSESQVRGYDSLGVLQVAFGTRGGGPGEFVAPVRAHRGPRGDEFLVLDMIRGVLRFSGTGEYLGVLNDTIFDFYYEMTAFGDSGMMVSGRRTGANAPALAVIDSEWGTITALGFERQATPSAEMLQASDWVKASPGTGDVAVLIGLKDTIYLAGGAGVDQSFTAIPIPLSPPFEPLPPPEELMRLGRRQLQERLVRVHDVFWLSQDVLVAQLFRRRDQVDHWRLVGMSRDGKLRFDIEGGPRLLAIRDGKFLFVDPDAPVPNQFLWMVPRCDLLSC